MLKYDGWVIEQTRGSYRQLSRPHKDGTVTVSGKREYDIPLGTLGSILKKAGLK